MPRAVWYDPDRAVPIERVLTPPQPAVSDLLAEVLSLPSPRGHPAVEFIRDDGTSISIATDGARAFLVWTNSLGETFHSVGRDQPGAVLVFDYFGSWSEAPAHQLVAFQDAVSSAEAFLGSGVPDTQAVIFTAE